MTAPAVFVGIDVSKARLDVALLPTGDGWAVANDERGIAVLVDRLLGLSPTLIVLEATGGLELPLTGALAATGLPVVVVNPRQVRDFAKATGRLAKTDALDAAVLAQFAEAVRPALRPLPDAATQALSALLTRRRQLLEMRTAEQNRLGSARSPVHKGIRAHIAWLTSTWTSAAPSGRVPSGASRMICCRALLGWGRSSPGRCWPTCPNWARSTGSRSLPWSASPRSTGTAGRCAVDGPSGAAGPPSGPRCT